MSNKKKAKHQSKKSSVAKNIAGGAVGTIFNVVLIIVAVMLIYYFAVSAYQLRGACNFGGTRNRNKRNNYGRNGF